MKDFFQNGPELTNTFQSDPILRAHLSSALPPEVKSLTWSHLNSVGEQAATNWLDLATDAERNEPKHIPYDSWGRRIDEIVVSEGWKKLEGAAAREGILATAYERKYGEYSRIYQMALLYLFHPSSAFVSCPLAMTDGAARALELYGTDEQKQRALPHLTSRVPWDFWTAGQWMTERTGGSDVSGTSTVARQEGGQWLLHGTKWFTSATTSQVAMTLARPEGAEEGSRGLSLFFVELRDDQGRLKNIQINRLKDKLGTRAMPTAELTLNGTPAELVGEPGGGVKKIASILNITRIYNSVCAIAQMRRGIDLALSYSRKREAFGRMLIDHPLHRSLLAEMEGVFKNCFELTFFVVGLLGKEETQQASESEKALLRALTPIVKLYTGKKCNEVISEVIEIFGGAGYIEDTGIPRLLRDAQVFSIWEGTTNVLSLDFLRSIEKDQALPVLLEHWKESQVQLPPRLKELIGYAKNGDREKLEASARELAYLAAETTIRGLRSHAAAPAASAVERPA